MRQVGHCQESHAVKFQTKLFSFGKFVFLLCKPAVEVES